MILMTFGDERNNDYGCASFSYYTFLSLSDSISCMGSLSLPGDDCIGRFSFHQDRSL